MERNRTRIADLINRRYRMYYRLAIRYWFLIRRLLNYSASGLIEGADDDNRQPFSRE